MSTRAIKTPIGPLTLQADESAVSAMRFGAGGALTGHAGRLEVKRKLLALEGINILNKVPAAGSRTNAEGQRHDRS